MFFTNLRDAPVDPIFGLKKEFLDDQRQDKVFFIPTSLRKVEMISDSKNY